MKRYEQFSHTADIGVRVFGRDIKELFENAAFSLFDVACDLEGITGRLTKKITVKADSPEELLVLWLDELLYNFYTKEIIFFEFHIDKISDKELTATVKGRPVGANKNRLKTEIKSVTYYNLDIKRSKKLLSVEMVFDV